MNRIIAFENRIKFSKKDEEILKNLNYDLLISTIDFLKKYKKVKWSGQNRIKNGEVYSMTQPLPIYPKELLNIVHIFHNEDYYITEKIEITSKKIFPSLMSPYEIYMLINILYDRDRFFDGLFGSGVEDNMYLSALLRLKELYQLYQNLSPEKY